MAVAVGHNIQHIELNTFNKPRFRPNMKTNEVDNSVNFYNTDVPDFGKFLLSETFADVQLICGEKKISAHRSRLSAVSPFLAAVFANDTSDASVIIIPDIKYETLRILIHFIYTGFIRATECEVYDLLEAGRMLGVNKSIDVEQVDFGRNQTTAHRNKQKRRTPAAGGKHSQAKKKKSSSPQTVVIFDTFESNTMQLPSVLGELVPDPLDVSDICSSDVISLHDESNTAPIQEMEMCSSPAPTAQEPLQVDENTKTTEEDNANSSHGVTIEDVRSTVQPMTSSQVPTIIESISQNKEAPVICIGNVSQNGAEPPLTPTREHNENLNEQQLDYNTCQEEFQSFLKKSTPPKELPEQEQVAKPQAMPIVYSTPAIKNITSLFASVNPVVTSNSATDNEQDTTDSISPNMTDKLEPEIKKQSSESSSINNINIDRNSVKPQISLPDGLSRHTPEISRVNIMNEETVTTKALDSVQQQEKIQVRELFSMSKASASNTIEQVQEKDSAIDTASSQLLINPTDKDVITDAQIYETQSTSTTTSDNVSPKPGLSKTVQQALAGLMMWKNFKQKQNKTDNQSVLVSPQKSTNSVQQTIKILTPKQPATTSTFSEEVKKIIEKELCNQLESQVDSLQIEHLPKEMQNSETLTFENKKDSSCTEQSTPKHN